MVIPFGTKQIKFIALKQTFGNKKLLIDMLVVVIVLGGLAFDGVGLGCRFMNHDNFWQLLSF